MPEKIFDVVIVGGSVAGNRTAELIAKRGRSVLLIEEHSKIGSPCKCTGLVSWRFKELLPDFPKKFIVNTIHKAKFLSPDGKCLELTSKKPTFVISRPDLDKFLFRKAKLAGVITKTGERVISFDCYSDFIKIQTDKNSYKAKILIGADGANSIVAKLAKIEMPKKYLVGIQTTAKGNYENDSVELWFGSRFAPKFFAWVVPENKNFARIGLASSHSPAQYYKDFLQKRIGKFVKPDVGGSIRSGLMKTTVAERIMLVGDAACQIKPYSGGGINYGLIASKICADAALSALSENNFSRDFFEQNYDDAWKKELGMPIKRGILLYKIISSPDPVLNFLFAIARIGKGILNNLDMDMINFFA